ncbi:YgaP family membrane protein [Roseivivax sp. CAU 1753]
MRAVLRIAMLFVRADPRAVARGAALFWGALIAAAVFALTAFIGNCPLYSIVGLKTCRDC